LSHQEAQAAGTAALPGVSFPLAFAALLHPVGAQVAAAICKRLRLSNAESERIIWLVRHHADLREAPTMRLSKLKPLLVHPGINELLVLHRAEAVAEGRSTEAVEFCERMLSETPPDELNPPPLLTGDDLRAAGLKPGPQFKRILDVVRVAQLEGRIRTKDEALKLAHQPPAPEA
jgi:poly(A) polymerase